MKRKLIGSEVTLLGSLLNHNTLIPASCHCINRDLAQYFTLNGFKRKTNNARLYTQFITLLVFT